MNMEVLIQKYILIILFLFPIKSFALGHSKVELNDFFNAVVTLKSDAPDASGDTTTAYCNATLIAKNMAITAAHCAHLPYVSGVRKMTIEKGEYLYKTRKDGTTARIGYVPKFTKIVNIEIEFAQSLKDKMDQQGFKAKIGPNNDVAILWWRENTDDFSQKSYPELVSPFEFPQIIKSISQYNPSVTTINIFSETSTLDSKRTANLNNIKWTLSSYVESKSIARVDEGDSGAPLFVDINGQKKLFAVVKGKAKTVFDNWDAFSSVTKISCEIDKRLPTEFRIKSCN